MDQTHRVPQTASSTLVSSYPRSWQPPPPLLTIPALPHAVTSKIGGEISSIGREVTSVIDGVEKSVESQYSPRRLVPVLVSAYADSNEWAPLTAIGSEVLTVVKDGSGAAFTLATDGVGLATTIGGQLYTVITSDIGHMCVLLILPC